MSNSLETEKESLQPDLNYEPPKIESALSPERLEREVLYAGSISHHGGEHDANPDTFSIRPF